MASMMMAIGGCPLDVEGATPVAGERRCAEKGANADGSGGLWSAILMSVLSSLSSPVGMDSGAREPSETGLDPICLAVSGPSGEIAKVPAGDGVPLSVASRLEGTGELEETYRLEGTDEGDVPTRTPESFNRAEGGSAHGLVDWMVDVAVNPGADGAVFHATVASAYEQGPAVGENVVVESQDGPLAATMDVVREPAKQEGDRGGRGPARVDIPAPRGDVPAGAEKALTMAKGTATEVDQEDKMVAIGTREGGIRPARDGESRRITAVDREGERLPVAGPAPFMAEAGSAEDARSVGSPTPKTASETGEIVRQIVDRARVLKFPDRTEVEIRLKPESLGRVVLKVSMESGRLSARFEVSDPEVRTVIETRMDDLRRDLAEQGLQVQSLAVSVGDGSGTNERGHGWADGGYPRANAVYGYSSSGEGATGDQAMTAGRRNLERRSLDLIA